RGREPPPAPLADAPAAAAAHDAVRRDHRARLGRLDPLAHREPWAWRPRAPPHGRDLAGRADRADRGRAVRRLHRPGPHRPGIHGVTTDLPLVVVVLLALRQGPEFGCVAGFAAGLLQDATGGGLIGVQALTKAVIGFAMGAAGSRLAVTQPLVQVPGLVLLTVAEGLARFALLKIFHFPATFGDVLLYVVLPPALYNGYLGAALVVALTCGES